jgi:DNA-binding HxlR family transcriptional regulator
MSSYAPARGDVQRVVSGAHHTHNLDFTEIKRASLTFELLFQGKWKLQILLVMCAGPVRLGQLARLIPDASKKMLTQNLRRLERDGIVIRADFSDIVLHVEYDLNPDFRNSISNLLAQLGEWGDQYSRRSIAKVVSRQADSKRDDPYNALVRGAPINRARIEPS